MAATSDATQCTKSGVISDAPLRWPELDTAAQAKGKHFDKPDQDCSEISERNVLAWLNSNEEADSGKQPSTDDDFDAKAPWSDTSSSGPGSLHMSEAPVRAEAALTTSSGYCCVNSACDPKIMVEETARELCSRLVEFFREGEESEVCEVAPSGLHFKAIVFSDFTPLDVEVGVFEAGEVGSFAVFSHPSRSDTVRLAQTLRLAAQRLLAVGFTVLQPRQGAGESILQLLDDDMSFSDDDSGLDDCCGSQEKILQPLLDQACSGLQWRRQEAAAALALLAKGTPRLRAPLAEALIAQPEVLKLLFSTGTRTRPEDALAIQYPAAAMLASVAEATEVLQAGTGEVRMKQVMCITGTDVGCSGMPRLVANKLTVALGLLRCTIAKC
eukprot:TRINITY_DN31377_c0_g1_i1.p1 TRINITY_DN31377_c0_g1~~TRINITY_DN31377_c0_g1_i1.p1  ORF type:complete len:384 (+),score=83.29 TRINITY_DN31377_c0_g1_i1:78-1229(+)